MLQLRSRVVIFVALLALIFYGCGEGRLMTESGKPEIFIPEKDAKTVIEGIIAWSAIDGRQVESNREYNVVTKRHAERWRRWVRTTYTIVKAAQGTKVYAMEVLLLPGGMASSSSSYGDELITTTTMVSGEERGLRSQGDYEEIQGYLEQIKVFILNR
jgi:hypothetical protein